MFSSEDACQRKRLIISVLAAVVGPFTINPYFFVLQTADLSQCKITLEDYFCLIQSLCFIPQFNDD